MPHLKIPFLYFYISPDKFRDIALVGSPLFRFPLLFITIIESLEAILPVLLTMSLNTL